MSDLPLALALTAGTVAAFNPCGFAMLPAYLTLLINDEETTRRGPVARALMLSAAMTAGFVTVFGLFGLAVTALAVSVGGYLPWASLVIGVVLAGLGLWLLSGRELLLRLPGPATGRPTTSPLSLYGYGLSYAVASLSCTVGPFLAVTSASLSGGGLLGGVAAFATYALGMGLVIAALSLAVAFARTAALARLRRLLPYVSRAGGILLTLAGLYVVYYGWYELRVLAGGAADDPIVSTATAVQATIADWLAGLDAAWIVGTLTLLGIGTLALRKMRRRDRTLG
ncbi:Cytochrome c biogenesis protein CcdA [Nonomuraea solani]|uniref:Cytochrome c biogenesis protein CcdA n=1 Tax=Nonomuraea solani TaxID=1144553 RepID=A0A1H6DAW4_9ACTN|nr:cytochrome c biogenesis protein CcdA [Nonomuraea solani]SEG82349.1 Cytochrome c biogenesis protein CcdA [Nonomuraea solani]